MGCRAACRGRVAGLCRDSCGLHARVGRRRQPVRDGLRRRAGRGGPDRRRLRRGRQPLRHRRARPLPLRPRGRRADRAHRVNAAPIPGVLGGLAFGRDGALYAARWTQARTGEVIELDPATGRVVRQVVGGLACPTGLAVDPVSGDIFVSSVYCVPQVLRISDGRPSPYVTGVHTDGLTFGSDGTLYLAHQPDASGYTVSAVSRQGAHRPGPRATGRRHRARPLRARRRAAPASS